MKRFWLARNVRYPAETSIQFVPTALFSCAASLTDPASGPEQLTDGFDFADMPAKAHDYVFAHDAPPP
jgi:hypothetical protein